MTKTALPSNGDRTASMLWIVLLTSASILTTLALACATPFTALAAIAATQMRQRDGIALMLLLWAASQAVGFCILGYPHDAKTILWGVALGTAAVAAIVAARAIPARTAITNEVARMAVAYVVATLAFKLVILLWSFSLGGIATALSPSINARQLLRNGEILVGLALLYRGLVSIGLPGAGKTASAGRRATSAISRRITASTCGN